MPQLKTNSQMEQPKVNSLWRHSPTSSDSHYYPPSTRSNNNSQAISSSNNSHNSKPLPQLVFKVAMVIQEIYLLTQLEASLHPKVAILNSLSHLHAQRLWFLAAAFHLTSSARLVRPCPPRTETHHPLLRYSSWIQMQPLVHQIWLPVLSLVVPQRVEQLEPLSRCQAVCLLYTLHLRVRHPSSNHILPTVASNNLSNKDLPPLFHPTW